MSSELLGKRKKTLPKCPNPLFIQWLSEWRDDAAAKSLKSQYTYSKALSSLKKYPIPLESGKECKVLEHFGDKICKMLDEKLGQHIITSGSQDFSDADSDELPSILPASATQRAPVCVRLDSDSSGEDICHVVINQERQQIKSFCSPTGLKEYTPQYRSGPYAILLTLLVHEQSGNSRGSMNKKDLMREAQPLSDKSFIIPDPGCRYTAWSSMGSLVKKALVVKSGSPARYSLTDTGSALATRLQQTDPLSPCSDHGLSYSLNGQSSGSGQRSTAVKPPAFRPKSSPSPIPSSKVTRKIGSIISADSGSDSECDLQINSPLPKSLDACSDSSDLPDLDCNMNTGVGAGGFEFCYVSDDNKEVSQKDKAAVLIDEDLDIGFLVLSSYDALLDSGKRYKLDTTRWCDDGRVYAYLHNRDAPETSQMRLQTALPETTMKAPATAKVRKAESHSCSNKPIKPASNKPASAEKSTLKSTSPLNLPNHTSTNPSSAWQSEIPQRSIFNTYIRPVASFTDSQGSSSSGVKSLSCESSQGEDFNTVGDAESDFVLHPGSFDVILCVDNCELFGGRSKCTKNALIEELEKNSVKFDVRKLQVGDFCWVAKDKYGSHEAGKELVLNHVVERKRMDDLAGSIVDGRFREQKYRLKNCGVTNAVYLVEDYGSTKNLSLPESTLLQAITNTQVIDGFYVKRTRDTRESAAYLTLMTRYLHSLYSDKTLVACSKKVVDSNQKQGVDLSHASQVPLMTFTEFNQASVKNRPLTVREMFGKQLVQLHSLTAEKAAAILDKCPTMISLFGAYEKLTSNKERENMISDLKFGPMARKMGGMISRTLSQLYTTADSLP